MSTQSDTQSPRDTSPTPTAPLSLITSFEKWNKDTFYRYNEGYHDAWTKWINTREAYKTWVNGLPQRSRDSVKKRGMKWANAEFRSSQFWQHFQEGASSRGVPQIRCVWCSMTIQHPLKNGSAGMKDHYESKKCSLHRQAKSKDPKIVETLRKQGEKVSAEHRWNLHSNLRRVGGRCMQTTRPRNT
jgi:hypothetical protein